MNCSRVKCLCLLVLLLVLVSQVPPAVAWDPYSCSYETIDNANACRDFCDCEQSHCYADCFSDNGFGERLNTCSRECAQAQRACRGDCDGFFGMT